MDKQITAQEATEHIRDWHARIPFSVEMVPLSKQQAGKLTPTAYIMNTHSWLMGPVIANALLGVYTARWFFPQIQHKTTLKIDGYTFDVVEFSRALIPAFQQGKVVIFKNDIQKLPQSLSLIHI